MITSGRQRTWAEEGSWLLFFRLCSNSIFPEKLSDVFFYRMSVALLTRVISFSPFEDSILKQWKNSVNLPCYPSKKGKHLKKCLGFFPTFQQDHMVQYNLLNLIKMFHCELLPGSSRNLRITEGNDSKISI